MGHPYIVCGAKDGQTAKRLLRVIGGGDEAVERLLDAARAMLADPWGRERASIGLLSSSINTWVRRALPPESTWAPRMPSDFELTEWGRGSCE
jgi:hypothetical protein